MEVPDTALCKFGDVYRGSVALSQVPVNQRNRVGVVQMCSNRHSAVDAKVLLKMIKLTHGIKYREGKPRSDEAIKNRVRTNLPSVQIESSAWDKTQRHFGAHHSVSGYYCLGGNIASIFRMIFSAIEIEFAMVASIAGHGLSYCASRCAARMLAAMSNTRFLPSSIRV